MSAGAARAYFILEWGAEEDEAGKQKAMEEGTEGWIRNSDSEDLSRGEDREGRERKINTQALPVIFLFGDRINILLS